MQTLDSFMEKSADLTKESASCTRDVVVLVERTGLLPITEAQSVVVGTASKVLRETVRYQTYVWTSRPHQDNAQNDEANNSQDLDGTEPELCFSAQNHVSGLPNEEHQRTHP
jgi:hypothetical protein